MNNYFVYGLSGAGKDTIANYLVENYGFVKMRIADTIKRIICEKYDITFEKLEELKRTDEKFRKEHHEVSEFLTMQSSLNRCRQIANKTSFDFQHFDHKMLQKPIVICDVRTIYEMQIFLANGYKGILLTGQNTKEFLDKSHYTEQNLFDNELNLLQLFDNYKNDLTIINNSNFKYKTEVENLIKEYKIDFYLTDGKVHELTNCVDFIIK